MRSGAAAVVVASTLVLRQRIHFACNGREDFRNARHGGRGKVARLKVEEMRFRQSIFRAPAKVRLRRGGRSLAAFPHRGGRPLFPDMRRETHVFCSASSASLLPDRWRVIDGAGDGNQTSVFDDDSAECGYRPSSFYFRRALRAANSLQGVSFIILSLHAEIAVCREFARANGVPECSAVDCPSCTPSNDLEILRATGLHLCCVLERVKRAIDDGGFVPPKRNVMRSEATEKGWPVTAS